MNPITIAEVLLSLFFAITFLQSGIDKLKNKSDNLSWFKSVFENTILSPIISPLFLWIMLLELITGLWMIVNVYCILFCSCSICFITDWAYTLCLFVLLQLFTGQRIAKDYSGASGIIPYIITALIGLLHFTCFE